MLILNRSEKWQHTYRSSSEQKQFTKIESIYQYLQTDPELFIIIASFIGSGKPEPRGCIKILVHLIV